MPSRKETQYKVRIVLKFKNEDDVKKALEIAKAVLKEHSNGCVEIEGGAICLSDICIPVEALMVVKFKPNEKKNMLLITAKSPEPMFIFHYIESLKEAIDKSSESESLYEPMIPVKMNIDILLS